MQMDRGAHRRLVGFRPVEVVVDGQEMFRRQLIGPFDQQPFTAASFKCRAGSG